MTTVDPITLEVVCEGMRAIVKEMRASIIRASFSSAIYELDDFSCALFNPQADMVAQSDDHPGHVMPMPWSVFCAMEDFSGQDGNESIEPGDVILLNDAYRGGTHLNDVTLLYPVFVGGELFIFPAVRAHWADVGGMTPGSYSGLATNIYQEGVRIPPIKLYERGTLNKGVMRLLMSNMRLPEEREGDLEASLGACRTAQHRIEQMVEKYSKAVVLACMKLNLDRSEHRLREKVAELPDGEYVYEDYLAQTTLVYSPVSTAILSTGWVRNFNNSPVGNYLATDEYKFQADLRLMQRVQTQFMASFSNVYYGKYDPEAEGDFAEIEPENGQRDDQVLRLSASMAFDIFRFVGISLGYNLEQLASNYKIIPLEDPSNLNPITGLPFPAGKEDFASYIRHIVFASLDIRY